MVLLIVPCLWESPVLKQLLWPKCLLSSGTILGGGKNQELPGVFAGKVAHRANTLHCLSWQTFMDDIEDLGKWGRVAVNSKCIGTSTCRVLAPDIFKEVKAKSQSQFDGAFTQCGRDLVNKGEYLVARQAVAQCAFKAIYWVRQPTREALETFQTGTCPAIDADYPKKIEVCEQAVFCALQGYHCLPPQYSPCCDGTALYLRHARDRTHYPCGKS